MRVFVMGREPIVRALSDCDAITVAGRVRRISAIITSEDIEPGLRRVHVVAPEGAAARVIEDRPGLVICAATDHAVIDAAQGIGAVIMVDESQTLMAALEPH